MAAKTAQKYLTFLLKNSSFLNAEAIPNLMLTPVSGGDINDAFHFDYKQARYFIKFKHNVFPNFFSAEADGLNKLRSACAFKIPEVIEVFENEEGGFILLSFLTQSGVLNHAEFGEKLAILHKNTNIKFGLDNDNYIGNLPQMNVQHIDWQEFFATQRILPLLKLAIDKDALTSTTSRKTENLLNSWNDLIPFEKPSFLHGDLWSGNTMQTTKGASIYDPAMYYGHREMDLSMMRLFGGFSKETFETYHRAFPLENGFEERIDLHNLYPLLVHTVLFGGSYGSQVRAIVKKHN